MLIQIDTNKYNLRISSFTELPVQLREKIRPTSVKSNKLQSYIFYQGNLADDYLKDVVKPEMCFGPIKCGA